MSPRRHPVPELYPFFWFPPARVVVCVEPPTAYRAFAKDSGEHIMQGSGERRSGFRNQELPLEWQCRRGAGGL